MLKRLTKLIMYDGNLYEVTEDHYVEKKTGRKINLMSYIGQKITQARENGEVR